MIIVCRKMIIFIFLRIFVIYILVTRSTLDEFLCVPILYYMFLYRFHGNVRRQYVRRRLSSPTKHVRRLCFPKQKKVWRCKATRFQIGFCLCSTLCFKTYFFRRYTYFSERNYPQKNCQKKVRGIFIFFLAPQAKIFGKFFGKQILVPNFFNFDFLFMVSLGKIFVLPRYVFFFTKLSPKK